MFHIIEKTWEFRSPGMLMWWTHFTLLEKHPDWVPRKEHCTAHYFGEHAIHEVLYCDRIHYQYCTLSRIYKGTIQYSLPFNLNCLKSTFSVLHSPIDGNNYTHNYANEKGVHKKSLFHSINRQQLPHKKITRHRRPSEISHSTELQFY